MTEKTLKILFVVLALAFLVLMLRISRDAGISGDEEVHYRQSEMVYQYFSTLGKDQSSVNTPQTHLQYYGQVFDNLVTALIHAFGIEDIYGFRHLMCSLAGWLSILVTALFAAWIAGYGAAIVVLLLFAVSPTFLGHAQNNLKDIPFAFAYIASVYFSLKLVFAEGKPERKTIVLLNLSIALSIGIRIGGILVVFYLALFMLLKMGIDWLKTNELNPKLLKQTLILFVVVSFSGTLLGLVAWPYALQNPLLHPWKSFQVMTHFPTTVRQIFEGKLEWSDFHPWYYLPKAMAITIPLVVFAGIAAFFLNTRKNYTPTQRLSLLLLGFTILFPMVFVLLNQSNLYGAWRHFLFLYPGILLISALGIHAFLIRFRQKMIRISGIVMLLALMIHPMRFMAANHPYYYLYYNQLTGGLKGAYGNYETDYYYHSMREGAEWLQEYLKNKPDTAVRTVGGNFPSEWYFRNTPNLKFGYVPYPRRSEYAWDYLIVANSYFSPFQLKNKRWPPPNTLHTIYADGVPICAVLERLTHDDLAGIRELRKGNTPKADSLLQHALQLDPGNEQIGYELAGSLLASGQTVQAEEQLQKCRNLNPDNEKVLTLSGDLALKRGDAETAASYYQQSIQANRKYLSAYPKLAAIWAETEVEKARKVLRDCLKINPRFQAALQALAESYRKTDPERARKLDEQIETIKNNP